MIDSLFGAQIRELWKLHGDKLSSEAFLPMTDDTSIELLECEHCAFKFFDPKWAGGSLFYEELARAGYYPSDSEEFQIIARIARKKGATSVLDIGCGHGAFLDAAAAAGIKTAGVELTPTAAEQCRKKGHHVISRPLEEIEPSDFGRFPLVTMFQVVEHVRDPVSFVRRATEFCAPNGLVVVSVPYDEGINGWADLVPHQWPPHHLTRWTRKSLRSLGEACGLKLESIHISPLPGTELRRYLRLNRRLRTTLNPPRTALPAALITLLGWGYSLTGGDRIWPKWGANITVVLSNSPTP